MSGFTYGEVEPEVACPYCGELTYAEYVDIGVGFQQVTGHSCEGCHAVEAGPYCDTDVSEYDSHTGWFKYERE